jgi:hypothetical protein
VEKDVTITMELTNKSTKSLTNVKLARYFGPADPLYSNDGVIVDLTRRSMSTHAAPPGLGLMFTGYSSSTVQSSWLMGDAMSPQGCSGNRSGIPSAPGWQPVQGLVTMTFGSMAPGTTKTAKIVYRRY